MLDTAIVARTRAEIIEESFAATQQDGHHHQMQLIDERGTKVLPDGGRSTSEKDIVVTGGIEGCTEGCFDSTFNEIESCSPLHFDRSMRLVSKHEHRVVEGGNLSPPAGPLALAPRSSDRAEHVPAHDGGAHARFPLREEVVVQSLSSTFSADHLTAAASGENPVMELGTSDTERMIEILVEPGGIAIERDREVADEQPRH
jgi:hypothetical protein